MFESFKKILPKHTKSSFAKNDNRISTTGFRNQILNIHFLILFAVVGLFLGAGIILAQMPSRPSPAIMAEIPSRPSPPAPLTTPPPPVSIFPTVDIVANGSQGPIAVDDGSTITLAWATTNSPTSCIALNDWSGGKNASGGSQSQGPLSGPATFTYRIVCLNTDGADFDGVIVNVNAPPSPTVNLRVDGDQGPITIDDGDMISLVWSVTNGPTSCTASGAWSGPKDPLGDLELVGPLSGPATFTYTIACSSAYGSDSDSVEVNVNAPQGGGNGGNGDPRQKRN